MLNAGQLRTEFDRVRANTVRLCEPLHTEDFNLQAMANTSPPKWHLAHTTWFFETFILKPWVADYQPYRSVFEYLFNSYYNGIGLPFSRPRRGLLSRPTVDEVLNYRDIIEHKVLSLLEKHAEDEDLLQRIELGLHHEQQHQELLLTDLKYSFSFNPLYPAYCPSSPVKQGPGSGGQPAEINWRVFEEALFLMGHEDEGFCFDNETPSHRYFLEPFALADRLVTNGEYLQFMADGGYQNPALWLADGWDWVRQNCSECPLYWRQEDSQWRHFTLAGDIELNLAEPVCHLNYYEADAYARWYGERLPTEFEWEFAAKNQPLEGNFLDAGLFHPRPAKGVASLQQLFGDVWEWTSSSYSPYPGFKPQKGAIGEYNGKFMNNQQVLRGGSCVSDKAHIRPSYRNFFYSSDQWQFTGIRLARTLQ